MVILLTGHILARLRRRGKPFVLGRLLSFVWFFSVNAHPKNTVVRPLLSTAAATGFANSRSVALRVDARQQHTGRFVVGVLRHQFAAKGFGERGRGEFFDLGAGGFVAGFGGGGGGGKGRA